MTANRRSKIPRNLALAFVLIAGLLLGLWLRYKPYQFEWGPCFERSRTLFLHLRPGCRQMTGSPRDQVEYLINEDGLRDRPRSEILAHPKRVLVMGDSFVEGRWLKPGETLAGRLNDLVPGFYFINDGLRATGPLWQLPMLKQLVQTYRPAVVLWFLADNDVEDDRVACAIASKRDAAGVPTEFELGAFRSPSWLYDVSERGLGGPGVQILRQIFFLSTWTRLLDSPEASRCDACLAFREAGRIAAAAGASLRVVIAPALGRPALQPYRIPHATAVAKLLGCLDALKIGHLDTSPAIPSQAEAPALYWEGDPHYNAAGQDRYAKEIAPLVSRLLRSR